MVAAVLLANTEAALGNQMKQVMLQFRITFI
jgi:hypothetical protein